MKPSILFTGASVLALALCSFAAPVPAPESPKLHATLEGHKKEISCLAFSPDGKLLASGCSDGTVKLWNVAEGKEINTLTGHKDYVKALAFSSDNKTLASSDQNGIIVWNVADGKEMGAPTFKTYATHMCFSPDGKTLATRDDSFRLWDLEKKQARVVFRLTNHVPRTGMIYTSEGKLLAAGVDLSAHVTLYDVTEGKKIAALEKHTAGVHCVAFSRDGKAFASGDHEAIRLWEVATGKSTATINVTDRLCCMAYRPDGKYLAVGRRTEARMWQATISLHDATTGKELVVLKGRPEALHCVVFSPDGRTLASCGTDKTIMLWSIPEVLKAEK